MGDLNRVNEKIDILINDIKLMKRKLNEEKILSFKKAILNSDRIFIYGKGNKEEIIGLTLKTIFIKRNKAVFDLYKADTMTNLLNTIKSDDLIIVISASDNNSELDFLNMKLKERGAISFFIGEAVENSMVIFTDTYEEIKKERHESETLIIKYSILLELLELSIS